MGDTTQINMQYLDRVVREKSLELTAAKAQKHQPTSQRERERVRKRIILWVARPRLRAGPDLAFRTEGVATNLHNCAASILFGASTRAGRPYRAITLAMTNVLPVPVAPSRVCCDLVRKENHQDAQTSGCFGGHAVSRRNMLNS